MKKNHIKTLTTRSLIGHVLMLIGLLQELTIAKEVPGMIWVGISFLAVMVVSAIGVIYMRLGKKIGRWLYFVPACIWMLSIVGSGFTMMQEPGVDSKIFILIAITIAIKGSFMYMYTASRKFLR